MAEPRSNHGRRLSALAVILMLIAGPTSATHPPEPVYTVVADFNRGQALNVVAFNDDHLRLDTASRPYPFVWTALPEKGTIVKIDALSGAVLGEYSSAPGAMAKSPWNATVDKFGGAWAVNRAETSSVPGRGALGSVVHIGLKENGQCVDRNNNGVIDTSTGLGDVRAWTNQNGANSGGGVSTAPDECVLHFVRVNGAPASSLSVTHDDDVWVGGDIDHTFDLLDGSTGQVLRTQRGATCGGLTGTLGSDETLWASRPLLRWNSALPPGPGSVSCYPHDSYGLTRDRAGNIWIAAADDEDSSPEDDTSVGDDDATAEAGDSPLDDGIVRKINAGGSVLGVFFHGGFKGAGVAAGLDGDIWVAHGIGSTSVGHLRSDGTFLGNVTVPSGPTDVSVDAAGKVWVASYTAQQVARIDPKMGPAAVSGRHVGAVDLTRSLGQHPDGLSDMTGSQLLGAPPRGVWTVVHDSGVAGHQWGALTWIEELTGGSRLTFEVSSSQDGVNFAPRVLAQQGGRLGVPAGRYLRIEVVFERATPQHSSTGAGPALHEVRITRVATTLEAGPLLLAGGVSPPQAQLRDRRLEATLSETASGIPIPGERVEFSVQDEIVCSAVTDANGHAICLDPSAGLTALLGLGYAARFAGSDGYTPSSSAGFLVSVQGLAIVDPSWIRRARPLTVTFRPRRAAKKDRRRARQGPRRRSDTRDPRIRGGGDRRPSMWRRLTRMFQSRGPPGHERVLHDDLSLNRKDVTMSQQGEARGGHGLGRTTLKRIFSLCVLSMIAFGPSAQAAHSPLMSVTSSFLDSITVPGTVPQPYALGTYITGGHGLSGTVPGGELAPYSTCPCYTLDAAMDGTRGNLLDHGWVGEGMPNPGPGPVTFDVGTQSSNVVVFPALDHSAWYGALEFTVHGTSNEFAARNPSTSFPGPDWTLAGLTKIYREGWEDSNGSPSGIETDDYASRWTFSQPVRYIAIYAMGSIDFSPDQPYLPDYENICEGETRNGQTLWCNDDMEIDAVAVPGNDAPGSGTQGCTPGYWKQSQHFSSWTNPYAPSTLFDSAFARTVFPGKNLLDVLKTGGGGLNALGRQAVAALLNSVSNNVDYLYSSTQVISALQAAVDNGGAQIIESQKNAFEAENQRGCPLGRS
jgi:hypothetical protein